VLGALGLGIYDTTREEVPETEILRSENIAALEPSSTPLPTQAATALPTATATTEVAALPTLEFVQPNQQESLTMLGESWQGEGVVAALDDVGLTLDDGTYVELAPAFFWTEIPLSIGDHVAIQGFSNGAQFHTQTLTLNNQTYAFRTADGQPLWSGGVENGQNGAQNQQIPMTEWQTLTGTLSLVLNNSLTMQTYDGQRVVLQLGQPRFVDGQAITFSEGDPIEVSGYWQNDQFRVGTLTKPMTNETLLLLDPNGRPLWGGPGRNGESGGTGNGQSNSGNSSNGYRGGRNTTEAGQ